MGLCFIPSEMLTAKGRIQLAPIDNGLGLQLHPEQLLNEGWKAEGAVSYSTAWPRWLIAESKRQLELPSSSCLCSQVLFRSKCCHPLV